MNEISRLLWYVLCVRRTMGDSNCTYWLHYNEIRWEKLRIPSVYARCVCVCGSEIPLFCCSPWRPSSTQRTVLFEANVFFSHHVHYEINKFSTAEKNYSYGVLCAPTYNIERSAQMKKASQQQKWNKRNKWEWEREKSVSPSDKRYENQATCLL